MSTYQQSLNFFQRRLEALETDIEDITAMYLQAVSQKNISLAEQCEITLRSARQHQYEVTQALKAYQRPVRQSV
jgi:archaellum component FlaC